jgi:hypothetical protein
LAEQLCDTFNVWLVSCTQRICHHIELKNLHKNGPADAGLLVARSKGIIKGVLQPTDSMHVQHLPYPHAIAESAMMLLIGKNSSICC